MNEKYNLEKMAKTNYILFIRVAKDQVTYWKQSFNVLNKHLAFCLKQRSLFETKI